MERSWFGVVGRSVWGYAARFIWVVVVSLIVMITGVVVAAALSAADPTFFVSADDGLTWRHATASGEVKRATEDIPGDLPTFFAWVLPAAAVGVIIQGLMVGRKKWLIALGLVTIYGSVAYGVVVVALSGGFGFRYGLGSVVVLTAAWPVWNLRGGRYRLMEAGAALLLGCVVPIG